MLQRTIWSSRYHRPGGSAAFPFTCSICDRNLTPTESRHATRLLTNCAALHRKKLGASPKASEIPGNLIKSVMRRRATTEKDCGTGLSPRAATIEPVQIDGQPPVNQLSHGLDRILFNPGVVHQLQDSRSGVYNFDPYLQTIMPVTEFDFDAVASYIVSSHDKTLETIARSLKKKYVGSTSSMTSTLAQFHFLLSRWRKMDLNSISKGFAPESENFSNVLKGPASIFLRYKGDGVYAIDPDKELDEETILSHLGRSMEKFLTIPPLEFEKYRKGNSHVLEQIKKPETYNYSTLGDFVMRSQLDAYDPRLPGTGAYDLKTRAVVSIRMDVFNFHLNAGYQIKQLRGQWESYEREDYDLIRTAFLKYSLQARIGRMDGVFVTYHNTEKIFGFRYVPLEEMDETLHGPTGSRIAAQEFSLSLQLLNKLLDRATAAYPEQSLRIQFDTRDTQTPFMYIFAEPLSEEKIEELQRGNRLSAEAFMLQLNEKLEIGRKLAEQQRNGKPDDEAKSKHRDQTNEAAIPPNDDVLTPAARVEVGEDGALEGTALGLNSSEETAAVDIRNEENGPVVGTEIDETFLSLLGKEQAKTVEDTGELLAMTLTTKNILNGNEVQRPANLQQHDEWEVEYSIAEITGKSAAWRYYIASQNRRYKPSERSGIDSWVANLRALSRKGRRWVVGEKQS